MFRLFDEAFDAFDLDSKPDPWDEANFLDLITENEDVSFCFED